MSDVRIRAAVRTDLPALTQTYNYYVVNTAVTFDIDPYTPEKRLSWFEQFAPKGRYRLVIAEQDGKLIGYAGTTRFRPKPAYDTTVETTIYCAPGNVSYVIGSCLYQALFDAIAPEDIHRAVAGYAIPNPASERLHARFGFKQVGIFHEVGRKFGRYWDVMWCEKQLR